MMNKQISGFQWDSGNREKCQKHGVSITEIENLFAGPLATSPDESHSQTEYRFQAIGKTKAGRGIFVIYTLRQQGKDTFIRPLSARYMHKKEVKSYEKENTDV